VRHPNRAFGSFRIASTAYQIMAHKEYSFKQQTQDCIAHAHKPLSTEAAGAKNMPVRSLLTCRDDRSSLVTSYIALPHTTGLITMLSLYSSDPEGNFRGNQLLGRSMSLSPLCTTLTNDLHVSTGAGIHHSFPWLHHGGV